MSETRPAPADRGFVSYAEAVLDALAQHPDRTALVSADGRRIRAAELRESTHRLARELAARGIGRGSTVALLTGNTPEALLARYAANLAGARVVFLYDGMAPETLARIVASVETELLLVDPTREQDAALLLPLVEVPAVAALGPGRHGEDILAAAHRQPSTPFAVPVGPDDDWCIRHTGGTTGIPKGIQLAHGPYRNAMAAPDPDAGDPPRYLACTALAHLAGLFADLTLHHGGTVVLQPAFEPGEVLAAVERERITDLWLLPPLLHQLLDHPAVSTTDLSALRRITYGGSPASPARLRQAAEVFGPVLHGVYGQSEALALTAVGPAEHAVTGRGGQVTVGRPLPGVEIAVRDEHGRTLPAGEEGEVHARTRGAMRGYWKQPELTAEVLRDGWVRTGDIGYLDQDGYLFLVDRRKDVIIVVGGHVYPSEVEELLLAHPGVAQCAVFAVRDEDATEHVHAAVLPAPGHHPDLAELREFVTTRKGRIYAPDAVHLVPAIPLTSVGKPDKKELLRLLGR
ncbi:AMP-binding protein [Kitasatospora sp. LaBMicrA B282]|uniref:AMP-binding protein n=1 Tax=Kitasatospora sp. LaBMicrA B282 TaxID=3420949 RepID=UPI003D0F77F8